MKGMILNYFLTKNLSGRFPWAFCSKEKSMNWVFGLLTRIPLSSKAFLHDSRYSVMSTSLSPHNTMSSENSIDSGASFLTLSVSTCISMRKRYGLKADPWCRPASTLNLLLSPATVRTFVRHPVYIVLDLLDIFVWYQPLPHGSPDLLPRDSVVGLL